MFGLSYEECWDVCAVTGGAEISDCDEKVMMVTGRVSKIKLIYSNLGSSVSDTSSWNVLS